jgi:hypothetical protein
MGGHGLLALVLAVAHLSHTSTFATVRRDGSTAALLRLRGGPVPDRRRPPSRSRRPAPARSPSSSTTGTSDTPRRVRAHRARNRQRRAAFAGGRTISDRLRLRPYAIIGINFGAPVVLMFLGAAELALKRPADRLTSPWPDGGRVRHFSRSAS